MWYCSRNKKALKHKYNKFCKKDKLHIQKLNLVTEIKRLVGEFRCN